MKQSFETVQMAQAARRLAIKANRTQGPSQRVADTIHDGLMRELHRRAVEAAKECGLDPESVSEEA